MPLVTIHGVLTGISRNRFVVSLLLSEFYMAVGLFQLNMLLRREEIKEFVNCLLQFNRVTAGELSTKN